MIPRFQRGHLIGAKREALCAIRSPQVQTKPDRFPAFSAGISLEQNEKRCARFAHRRCSPVDCFLTPLLSNPSEKNNANPQKRIGVIWWEMMDSLLLRQKPVAGKTVHWTVFLHRSYRTHLKKNNANPQNRIGVIWWEMMDSNHRS